MSVTRMKRKKFPSLFPTMDRLDGSFYFSAAASNSHLDLKPSVQISVLYLFLIALWLIIRVSYYCKAYFSRKCLGIEYQTKQSVGTSRDWFNSYFPECLSDHSWNTQSKQPENHSLNLLESTFQSTAEKMKVPPAIRSLLVAFIFHPLVQGNVYSRNVTSRGCFLKGSKQEKTAWATV